MIAQSGLLDAARIVVQGALGNEDVVVTLTAADVFGLGLTALSLGFIAGLVAAAWGDA